MGPTRLHNPRLLSCGTKDVNCFKTGKYRLWKSARKQYLLLFFLFPYFHVRIEKYKLLYRIRQNMEFPIHIQGCAMNKSNVFNYSIDLLVNRSITKRWSQKWWKFYKLINLNMRGKPKMSRIALENWSFIKTFFFLFLYVRKTYFWKCMKFKRRAQRKSAKLAERTKSRWTGRWFPEVKLLLQLHSSFLIDKCMCADALR